MCRSVKDVALAFLLLNIYNISNVDYTDKTKLVDSQLVVAVAQVTLGVGWADRKNCHFDIFCLNFLEQNMEKLFIPVVRQPCLHTRRAFLLTVCFVQMTCIHHYQVYWVRYDWLIGFLLVAITLNLITHPHMGDSGEKSPRRFFRWFWDFLPLYLLRSLMLICFSKCNLHFQLVLVYILRFKWRKYH